MEAYLPVAQPSAALHQPARCDSENATRSTTRVTRRISGTTLSRSDRADVDPTRVHPTRRGGVGIMQLVWVALLAYATYATWQRLPL